MLSGARIIIIERFAKSVILGLLSGWRSGEAVQCGCVIVPQVTGPAVLNDGKLTGHTLYTLRLSLTDWPAD